MLQLNFRKTAFISAVTGQSRPLPIAIMSKPRKLSIRRKKDSNHRKLRVVTILIAQFYTQDGKITVDLKRENLPFYRQKPQTPRK